MTKFSVLLHDKDDLFFFLLAGLPTGGHSSMVKNFDESIMDIFRGGGAAKPGYLLGGKTMG